ncbi:hypothetical protein MPTK2_1g09260 [Marchantia polymorpha subsp. ruderalis]
MVSRLKRYWHSKKQRIHHMVERKKKRSTALHSRVTGHDGRLECESVLFSIRNREDFASRSETSEAEAGEVVKRTDSLLSSRWEVDNLFSQLPNEIVIDSILTRLPWKSLYTVSALNRSWQWAFRSCQVYNARVSKGQAHSLIAMTNASPFPNAPKVLRAISLYDPSQDAWYLLPPIPGVEEGIPVGGQCAFLKGKLYVIGGFTPYSVDLHGDEVFSFDLGSYQGGWRRCAKLDFPREGFSCHVKDDKIFVCGGLGYDQHMCRKSYVYHPEQDRWTPISDMLYKRSGQKIVGFGGGFRVYGGRYWSDRVDSEAAISNSHSISGGLISGHQKNAQMESFTEMYDPSTDTWVEVENFAQGRVSGSYVVSASGELYHVYADHIDRYNLGSKSWERFHINLWRVLEKVEVSPLWPCAAAFVDGELYILMASEDRSVLNGEQYRVIPLKSIGFGTGLILHWQEVGCPYGFGVFGETNCSIHHIKL